MLSGAHPEPAKGKNPPLSHLTLLTSYLSLVPPPRLVVGAQRLEAVEVEVKTEAGEGGDRHLPVADHRRVAGSDSGLLVAALALQHRAIEGRRRELLRRHRQNEAVDVVEADRDLIKSGEIG